MLLSPVHLPARRKFLVHRLVLRRLLVELRKLLVRKCQVSMFNAR